MTMVQGLLNIMLEVAGWFAQAFNAITPIFYVAETGWTLLGSICIATLAFSVGMLLIRVVQNFVRFRS